MKKIINGKVYDTDKARDLGFDCGGDGFSHWREELYQKRTGEYFLHGEGGPMTKYAVHTDQNRWSGGERILPLTPESARQWAEEHLSADDYEAIFGIPDEDSTERVTLCIQIPAHIDAIARAAASERGISLSAYINDILAASCK